MKKFEQYQDKIARLFPPKNLKGRGLARTITFQVTDDCNLRCTYCYQINKGKHIMDFEIAKKFIDMLLDADENSNEYINTSNSPAIIIEFIGGEPFLAIDLIDQITDYFISQMILRQHPWATRYMISISSNGVLYFNPKVQQYIKKHMNHLSFNISIDGNKKLHDACRVFPDGTGSYDIAMRGVKHFTEVLNGRMGSKMTLAPENVIYTSEAVRGLIESGYSEINLNCVYEKGWEQEHATILYYQLKELADYIIDNNLQDFLYISMFQELLGCSIPETDLDNWCFKAGTMILTPSGNIPIEYLKVGDNVISGEGNIQEITKIFKRDASNSSMIKACGTFPIYTTANHPFWTRRFSHIGNKGIYRHLEPFWVEAGDLKKGDKIALYCHKFGTNCVSPELAYIVGRYIGDGWNSTTGYKICCSYDEYEDLEEALNNANIKHSCDDYRTVKQFNIFKSNKELIELLSDSGRNALGKKIPSEAFSWDKESVKNLLKGLFDADGYTNQKKGKQCFNTISSILANDVLLLLRGMGYFPTCYFCERAGESFIEGRKANINNRYEIYYYFDKSKSKYCEYDEANDVIWTTVREVDSDIKPYEVFNMTVDNDHTYIADNAIVHNCGGLGYMISIDYKGDIYPCIRYMESSLGEHIEPIIIGNVYEGIMATEKQREWVKRMKAVDRRTQSTDECFYCPIARGCAWCSAYNYQETGSVNKRVTYICEMHKARCLANRYYWQKVYKSRGQNKEFELNVPKNWALKIICEEEFEMLKKLSCK